MMNQLSLMHSEAYNEVTIVLKDGTNSVSPILSSSNRASSVQKADGRYVRAWTAVGAAVGAAQAYATDGQRDAHVVIAWRRAVWCSRGDPAHRPAAAVARRRWGKVTRRASTTVRRNWPV
jgi:hypothetical protein